MDETIPSISRYPPVEVHRDPSTGMTWFAWTAPRDRNRQSPWPRRVRRQMPRHRWLRLPTGCSPRTCRACRRRSSPRRFGRCFEGDGLGVSLSVTVLIGGALHAQSGQGLSGGQLLEDQACTIALPAHNRVCLVEVAGVLQASAHRRDMLVELRELRSAWSARRAHPR